MTSRGFPKYVLGAVTAIRDFSFRPIWSGNWANHDRYRLRPSTSAQLCWSSSRLQPLQNNNLNKFAIIRPSNLHHNKNVWNCRGAPDETTCLTDFFRCPSALTLICMKLFNICANKLSLSLSLSLYPGKTCFACGCIEKIFIDTFGSWID